MYINDDEFKGRLIRMNPLYPWQSLAIQVHYRKQHLSKQHSSDYLYRIESFLKKLSGLNDNLVSYKKEKSVRRQEICIFCKSVKRRNFGQKVDYYKKKWTNISSFL